MGQVFEVYFWVAAVWERGRWGEGGQRRNTGVSPLRRQSAPPSVEMTFAGEGALDPGQSEAEVL